jgi:hypothetical protein
MVRLTVTHDEFKPGTNMFQKIANGWPRVLSSLKSFLETGRPLPTWAQNRRAARPENRGHPRAQATTTARSKLTTLGPGSDNL